MPRRCAQACRACTLGTASEVALWRLLAALGEAAHKPVQALAALKLAVQAHPRSAGPWLQAVKIATTHPGVTSDAVQAFGAAIAEAGVRLIIPAGGGASFVRPEAASAALGAAANWRGERVLRLEGLLEGGVPPALLAGRALTNLNLARCGLTEVPRGVQLLQSLTDLNLGGNRIAAIAEDSGLWALRSLRKLSLNRNQLRSLPQAVLRLAPSLTSLDLSHNRLEELPAGVLALHGLGALALSGNPIESLPLNIVDRLPVLTSLKVDIPEYSALDAERVPA